MVRGHRAFLLLLLVILWACSAEGGTPDGTALAHPFPPTSPFDGEEWVNPGPFRVLFDNSHGETAGNADWVIDDQWPLPEPSSPTRPDSWQGAISSWGYDLWATGRYRVETLPPGGRITWGDPSNRQDLARYDLYVVPEPNRPFTRPEKSAILDFVADGGGLFMVADHGGADRDGDGWDACEVWNDLLQNNDRQRDPFGLTFDGNSIWESPITNLLEGTGNPLLDGPFGHTRATSYYAGSTISLTGTNPQAQGLIWRNSLPHGPDHQVVTISRYGEGRVVAIGDSSPADDGSANPGNDNIYDGWTESEVSNRVLFLNASAWLVQDSGS